MLLLIDNYDSFTYNLKHVFEESGIDVQVIHNDARPVQECMEMRPAWVVIGPGPGSPAEAGISNDIIRVCVEKEIPVLGVCLGHQCLAEVFGGRVIRSPLGPKHGKMSRVYHTNRGVFHNVPDGFEAVRYHSLIVERSSLPLELEITAQTEEGEIMGLKHRDFSVEGVQFHPESVMTAEGKKILSNFLDARRSSCLEY